MLIANSGDLWQLVEPTPCTISAVDAVPHVLAHDVFGSLDGGITVSGWWIRQALRDAGELPEDAERFVAKVMAAIRLEMHAKQHASTDAT
jgi:hypothetical protein